MPEFQDHTGKLIQGFIIIGQDRSPGNPWQASCSKCGKINLMPRRYVNKMPKRGGECRFCGFKSNCWTKE